MIERRSLLKCLVGLVAAPAIIKVGSIMPVNAALALAAIALVAAPVLLEKPVTRRFWSK